MYINKAHDYNSEMTKVEFYQNKDFDSNLEILNSKEINSQIKILIYNITFNSQLEILMYNVANST